jgi:hypothetical protein
LCDRCEVRFFVRLYYDDAGILDVFQGGIVQYDGKICHI